MKTKEILEIIRKAKEEKHFNYFGIRTDKETYNVGDETAYSYDVNDDVEYDEQEELCGTCSTGIGDMFFLEQNTEEEDIEAIESAINFNKNMYEGSHMYVIGGKYSDCGTDEKELVIYNDFGSAEVICVL